MKKVIEIYSKISCAIFITVIGYIIIFATLGYFHRNDKNWIYSYRENILQKIFDLLIYFTLYNGIFLLTAGIYLLFQKNKILGIVSVSLPIIFYVFIWYALTHVV